MGAVALTPKPGLAKPFHLTSKFNTLFLRALLTKLETVESALEGAGGSIGSGAIPKRKPHSRRLRQSGHRYEVVFHRRRNV